MRSAAHFQPRGKRRNASTSAAGADVALFGGAAEPHQHALQDAQRGGVARCGCVLLGLVRREHGGVCIAR